MTTIMAIKSVQVIIGIAVFFQTLEYILIKEIFSECGVWKWSQLKAEFYFLPHCIQRLYCFLLKNENFIFLLWIRLIASILYVFSPLGILIFILFFSTLLIAQRFRGSYNGGSDYMSLIILSALFIQSFSTHSLLAKGALWYITFQSVTSYFLAGFMKLKMNSWRNGNALVSFIQSPNYNPPNLIKKILSHKLIAFSSSWIVILFELSFPVILMQHNSVIILWLFAGFLFHLINFFIFGLNRFLIVWLASYPAIYFCTK